MILSIIIPMYKVEEYVERCILSTQNQDIGINDYEVIVVNDGSPDDSLEIAEKIAEHYTNIKVVSRPNGGLSAARNTGIEKSSGEYLFFLDSDDWIENNCLGGIVKKLETERPDVLCINICNTNGVDKWGTSSFKNCQPKTGPEALSLGLNPMAQLSIVSRSFLDKYQFRFCEGIYHEDSELTPRIHYTAAKVSFLNGLIYNYYVNDQSIMRKPNPKKSHDLISVVCPHLSQFCEEKVKSEDKYMFHNMISMYLNNSLNFILKSDREQQKEFERCMFGKKELFFHCKKSTVPKYKIEGFLFTLFPHKVLSIYKLLFSLKK